MRLALLGPATLETAFNTRSAEVRLRSAQVGKSLGKDSRLAAASARVLQQPPADLFNERPRRRSPPLCFNQERVKRAARLAALQASKRTGMKQSRLHSTAACQTSRASIRACFPPRPTRHRRRSFHSPPFALRVWSSKRMSYPSYQGYGRRMMLISIIALGTRCDNA